MRINLVLRSKPQTFIPFNYNSSLNAMILDKIRFADPEYAQEIHDSKGFKFFTFSELTIPKRKLDKRGGLVILSNTISLFVSSPRDRFVRAFLSGVLCRPQVRIGPAEFTLENANALPSPDFSTGVSTFRTMTPIIASTKREIGGKLRSWDLMPTDNQFYNNIRNNIIRKYKKFTGRIPKDGTLNVKVMKPLRPRRIKVKEEFHTGSRIVFEASGNPELLEFAYECGFGERNSMGFGMVRTEDSHVD
ncbi:MAG: CRISPR-associated endoribonuclease Cas6 [Candidatus Heimdallarchaeota archaeon]|nr:CRISPR-associated endoribonuclease Cas6 [Candidatus Heimdallarchaeota archaeon]